MTATDNRMSVSVSVYADLLLALCGVLETNRAVDQSEQGIIASDTDIGAGTDGGASLPDEDIPRQDSLTVRSLDAEPLGLAVPTVLGGTDALLMSKELQTELQHLTYLHNNLCVWMVTSGTGEWNSDRSGFTDP